MARRKSGTSRREFTEKVTHSETEMKTKEGDLDVYASDLEQERHTRESLDLNGAEEDARDVDQAIERAEDVTGEKFGEHNEQLEGLQQENQGLESDFSDRKDSAESDVEKLQQTKLDSSEAVSSMIQAKEAALRGKEFLSEQMDKTHAARDASEQAQKELESRVNAIRGSKGK
ncbi:hypothetical protein AAU61_21605 [Desulfocarbo indianensis]|nr:hypothetical protein AAU61_21605 [Desulfocarbo indianensis]